MFAATICCHSSSVTSHTGAVRPGDARVVHQHVDPAGAREHFDRGRIH
jgi:hypothetical protein